MGETEYRTLVAADTKDSERRGRSVDAKALASFLGYSTKSTSQIDALCTEGMPVLRRGERGKRIFDTAQVVVWLKQRERRIAEEYYRGEIRRLEGELRRYRNTDGQNGNGIPDNADSAGEGGRITTNATSTPLNDRTPDDIDGGALTGRAREQKLGFEAKLKELELREKQGQLVPVELVERELNAAIIRSKTRLLGIPTKLAPRLVMIEKASEVQVIVETEINEALHELSGIDTDKIGGVTLHAAVGAAAEIHGQRVGR